MTDRELLELAAKAAGIDTKRCLQYEDGAFDWPGKAGRWNPLTNDGDALRLAVKLGVTVVSIDDGQTQAAWVDASGVIYTEPAEDKYAATRRAIVRAAAEIGRAVP